jgi:hypothetical protein
VHFSGGRLLDPQRPKQLQRDGLYNNLPFAVARDVAKCAPYALLFFTDSHEQMAAGIAPARPISGTIGPVAY